MKTHHGYEILADVPVSNTRSLHVHRVAADGSVRIRMMLNTGSNLAEGTFVTVPRDCAEAIGKALLKASR